MNATLLRKLLPIYLLLLAPVFWLAQKYAPYNLDGDAVAYMDLSDLILHGHWRAIANGYWNPLYPAALALGQRLAQPSRVNELGVFYAVNFFIFAAEIGAMLLFVSSLCRLRERLASPPAMQGRLPVLSLGAMRFLGVALVVLSAQRELSLEKVRPDALLQALLMSALAMLLYALASESLWFAPLIGLFFGLAYLSKSFALVAALLSIAVLVVLQGLLQKRAGQKRAWVRALAGGVLAGLVFAAVAGPYIWLLSNSRHRLDFGDSGALNFAWFSAGVDRFHLEPGQTSRFAGAAVHLLHPEGKLLNQPAIYSYKSWPHGTYPDWFDPSYWNERVTPHVNLRPLVKRDARNLLLVVRYLFNHPEAPILLALLLLAGARFRFGNWRRGFWIAPVLLGLAMWFIYGLVNIEERYVTVAYLLVVLPLFAVLREPLPHGAGSGNGERLADRTGVDSAPLPGQPGAKGVAEPASSGSRPVLPFAASGMVLLLASLALGESLRTTLESRRLASGGAHGQTWRDPRMFGAAEALASMGVKPGDQVACMDSAACLHDPYWARLAGVRITTEVYNDTPHLLAQWEGLPNRPQVEGVLKAQGASVLVARFDPGDMTGRTPGTSGWLRLGDTDLYALPLNLRSTPPAQPPAEPWTFPHELP